MKPRLLTHSLEALAYLTLASAVVWFVWFLLTTEPRP